MIDADGRAKIVDFGISVLAGDKRRTTTGAIGSPWYMSPEQITRPKEIDHRSDIYSLGITLFEMLTGTVPFDGETEFVIQNQHINSPPPDPSELNPEINAACRRIILRALEKKSEDRFQSCEKFLQAILACEAQPTSVRPGQKSDIFISYKREEQAEARKLADALEREGWRVWWDPKLRAGERFDDAIEAALQETKCVVVLWSKRSVKSPYVKDEAGYALNRGKLVPVAIEDVKLPFRFEGLQTPQLIDWDGSKDTPEFRRLIEDVSTIIGHPTLEPGAIFRDTLKDGSQGPEMVVIQAGRFEMGDIWGDGTEQERPVHTVHIRKPFALGRYPVTFEEYDTFIKFFGKKWPSLPDDQGWGRGQRPVINVSQGDALFYADWLSQQTGKRYRLPSEAEWEYAARSGGKEKKWAGTSAEEELADYAWYRLNSNGMTHSVGEKKPNGLGLYDMSGNVWEWVQDAWARDYERVPKDGSALPYRDSGGVIRGGCWDDGPSEVRSAVRRSAMTKLPWTSFILGFRLARDL